MRCLLFAGLLTLTCGVHPATAAPPGSAQKAEDEVFGLTKLWDLQLTISEKNWERMLPTRGGFGGPGMFGAPGGGRPPAPPADDTGDRRPRGMWGFDFEWVKGAVEVGGKKLEVGVRFKGNSTYASSQRTLKRPLKIDFDRYDKDQNWLGVRKICLNNHTVDTSGLRESLSFAFFRAAGIPTPRTAYAQVTLTVPGKHDKEYLGLYTLVEAVDKPFLKKHFGSSKGLLLKPEKVGFLAHLGNRWESYSDYHAKTDPTKAQKKRLIEFTKLIHRGDDAAFKKEIGDYLDIDQFLRFTAATVLVSTMDSMLTLGHNFYLYLDAKSNKFHFIPWDFDHSFGAFYPAGSSQALADLSIRHPWTGSNRLLERLFADEKIYAAYRKHVETLAKTALLPEQFKADVKAIKAVTGPILEKETKARKARKEGPGMFGPGGFGPGGFGGSQAQDIVAFVEKRSESVKAQLAGKSEGKRPNFGFGPGGPGRPGGPGGPGGRPPVPLGQTLAKQIIERSDKNRDGKLTREEAAAGAKLLFKVLDQDGRGALDQKALAAGLQKLLPPAPKGFRPGGFGGFGGGGPGRPAFTPPHETLAKAIFDRAGKDGSLSEAALVEATGKLFAETDRTKAGKIDDKQILTVLEKMLPQPPRFGGFGGGGFPGSGFPGRP